MPPTPRSLELAHPRRLVHRVDRRLEPERRRSREPAPVTRPFAKPTAQAPAARRIEVPNPTCCIVRSAGPERARLLERAALEADDHVVVEQQRRATTSCRCSRAGASARPSRRSVRGRGRAPPRASGSRRPPRRVVDDDEVGCRHVELDVVGADLDRALERGQRVLRQLGRRAAVGDDEHQPRAAA